MQVLLLLLPSIVYGTIRIVPDPNYIPTYCSIMPCCDVMPNAQFPYGVIIAGIPVPFPDSERFCDNINSTMTNYLNTITTFR